MAVNANSQPLKPQPYPSLQSIDEHHSNVREIITQYFKTQCFKQVENELILTSGNNLFVGATPKEIQKIRDELLDEEERRSCFALLAYIEATFKAHFLYVVDTGTNCKLQNTFRKLFNSKKNIMKIGNSPEIVSGISFKSEILMRWRSCGEIDRQTYDNIIGAFAFRNWFAHGRFLTLKPSPAGGIRYQYSDLYILAKEAKRLCALATLYLS